MAELWHEICDYEHEGDYDRECAYVRRAFKEAGITDFKLSLREEEKERDWDDECDDEREPDGYVCITTETTPRSRIQEVIDNIRYN